MVHQQHPPAAVLDQSYQVDMKSMELGECATKPGDDEVMKQMIELKRMLEELPAKIPDHQSPTKAT